MTGQIEIIGTNSALEDIKGKKYTGSVLFNEGVHSLELDGQKYCFEVKDILVKEDAIVLNGWASDKELNLGKISLAFKPNKA
tara:strand:+ start:1249 stop:1494 length:246 start_codon:yes stop_codon:yes gene_type:complete